MKKKVLMRNLFRWFFFTLSLSLLLVDCVEGGKVELKHSINEKVVRVCVCAREKYWV